MASMDGTAALYITSFPGPYKHMATQLFSIGRTHTQQPMELYRYTRYARILWDSRGRLQTALFMRTNVFARIYMTLELPTPYAMGQHAANISAYREASDKIWREDLWDREK